MAQTTARIIKGGKRFEILVDEDEAIKFRKDVAGASLGNAVLTEAVFYNLKSGEHASRDDMENKFGTSEFSGVCSTIIKQGEIVRTTASLKDAQDTQYKKVVDFLVKNAVSLSGTPYTADVITRALREAHIQIKNKPLASQISSIIDSLRDTLPLKVAMKKVKLRIPAQYTGTSYGIVKEFMQSEEWMDNGDLEVIVGVPAGMIMDFYDSINASTKGSVLSEEVKE